LVKLPREGSIIGAVSRTYFDRATIQAVFLPPGELMYSAGVGISIARHPILHACITVYCSAGKNLFASSALLQGKKQFCGSKLMESGSETRSVGKNPIY
jgi:hypothetical protein